MSTTLAHRIREARGALSREKLAVQISKSASAIRNWESGANEPSDGDKMLLARATGVRFEWLKTGEGEMRASSGANGIQPNASGDGITGAVTLTVYDLATSGPASPIAREESIGRYTIDLVEIDDLYTDRPDKPFVVEMIGDSMEPEFRSGDRLIIEPYASDTRTIQASGVYLFRLEDLIEVQQLQRLPGGRLQISARNAAYPVREIEMGVEVDFEIIGRVWGKFKRY